MDSRERIERDYRQALASLDTARRSLRPTSRSRLFGVTKAMLERAYLEEREVIEELYRAQLGNPNVHTADKDTSGSVDTPDVSASVGSILAEEQVGQVAASYRAAGKTIVFTNGCFDLIHSGHITYLSEAKRLGDILVVGLNSDDSVRRLKGPARPVLTIQHRSAVLAGLTSVDHVVVFDEDTAEHLVELIRPNIYVKGGDYRPEYAPPEALVAERYGATYQILSYVEGVSTTNVIERIKRT